MISLFGIEFKIFVKDPSNHKIIQPRTLISYQFTGYSHSRSPCNAYLDKIFPNMKLDDISICRITKHGQSAKCRICGNQISNELRIMIESIYVPSPFFSKSNSPYPARAHICSNIKCFQQMIDIMNTNQFLQLDNPSKSTFYFPKFNNKLFISIEEKNKLSQIEMEQFNQFIQETNVKLVFESDN